MSVKTLKIREPEQEGCYQGAALYLHLQKRKHPYHFQKEVTNYQVSLKKNNISQSLDIGPAKFTRAFFRYPRLDTTFELFKS